MLFHLQRIQDGIKQLRELISKRGRENILYEQSDEFLARYLRICKFDIEKALKRMDAFYVKRATMQDKMAPRGKGPKDTAFFVPLNSVTVLDRCNWDGSLVTSKFI